MKLFDLQVIGEELALKWDDGTEAFLTLETLRRRCPCAECQGERDVMGTLHKPPTKPMIAASFQLAALNRVGAYAVQPSWRDGHSAGIYSFEYLRALASGQ